MNDDKTQAGGTYAGSTTPAPAKGAPKDEKGQIEAGWKTFNSVLGQFNTLIVLQADKDLEGAITRLIELTCRLDSDRCRDQYGPNWVWDPNTQRCVWVPTP